MADQERLITIFEARIRDFEKKMQQSVRTTQRARRDIEKEADRLAKNLETRMAKAGGGFSGVMGLARNALGIAGIGLSAGAIANLTSEWSDLNSRIANAVGSMSRGEEVMGRIAEMARRSYSSLGQTADSFIRNADALTELGYNTGQQLDMTEALNNALVISATRGQQAEAVQRAWSQALATGALRGDNLNTVIQNSSRLTRALADSMGVSTNELRALGAAGEITARDMVGVSRQLETLRAEADAMPATITDSFVLLGNSVMQLVGNFDQATGATSWLAGEIILLADSIEEAARRWKEGDVPVLKFMEAAAGLSRELGILREVVEDDREEFEVLDEAVGNARLRFMELAAELTMLENMRAFAPELPGEIQAVVDKLLLGESSAEEARLALLDLASTNPDFGLVIGQLAGVAAEIRTVTAAADEMHAALNAAGGPTGDGAGRGGAGASRRARIEAEEAAAAYIAEQDRILGLSREQLTLEQAITAEKERAAAAGITLGDAEAKRLAQLRITQSARSSGGSGASGVEKFDADMERYRERIALLEMETELQRGLNPLINDYGYALEKARAQHELENAAAKAGLELTPQRREEIEKLAESYGTATANAARLAEEQNAVVEQMNEIRDAARAALETIIDGFLEGKDAGEIFSNVLRDIGRQLLTMGINNLTNLIFPTPGIGAATGGLIRGPGTGTSDSIPARLSNGEYVVNARQTAKHRELLDAINSGRVPGFATGGLVGLTAPTIPRMPEVAPRGSGGDSVTVSMPINIDATGADMAAVARLQGQLVRLESELPGRVKQVVKGWSRLGGNKW